MTTPIKPKVEDLLLHGAATAPQTGDLRQASSVVAAFLKTIYSEKFASLEDLRQRLDFIPSLIARSEELTKKKLELGEHHLDASRFSSLASKVMGKEQQLFSVSIEESKLPLVATLSFIAPASIPRLLTGSLPLVEQHDGLKKLLMESKELADVAARKQLFPWMVDDDISYALYNELSKLGFKTSKIRLTPTEYKDGKTNSKNLVEGMMNKWLFLWYVVPGLQTTISILSSVVTKIDGLAGGYNALAQTAKNIKEPVPMGYQPNGI